MLCNDISVEGTYQNHPQSLLKILLGSHDKISHFTIIIVKEVSFQKLIKLVNLICMIQICRAIFEAVRILLLPLVKPNCGYGGPRG